MNNDENILVALKGLILGVSWNAIAFQAISLAIISVFTTRQVIRNRIGSLEAIRVASRMRLVICYILCLAIFLIGYQIVLRTKAPIDAKSLSWWSLKCILGVFLSYIPVLFVGVMIDGGRAIEVITQRYKPDTPREPIELTDLTKDRGRYAQLIPRGCVRACWFLSLSAIISQAIGLK